MTQDLTPIHPACDASAINDLLVAAVAALGDAIQTDLPPMTVLAPAPGSNDDLPQDARRDLYAAERLYGVCFGGMRAVTRRPGIADTQTLIIPQGAGYKIIVLCVSGAAAVYAPNGRCATLDATFYAVTKEKMQEWIDASARRFAEIASRALFLCSKIRLRGPTARMPSKPNLALHAPPMKATPAKNNPRRVFVWAPLIDFDATSPMRLRIDSLRAYLSNRTVNALRRSGVETIGDVVALGGAGLAAIPRFGKKSQQEILGCLRAHCVMVRVAGPLPAPVFSPKPESIARWNPAMHSAWRKGAAAYHAGANIRACPYEDRRKLSGHLS